MLVIAVAAFVEISIDGTIAEENEPIYGNNDVAIMTLPMYRKKSCTFYWARIGSGVNERTS